MLAAAGRSVLIKSTEFGDPTVISELFAVQSVTGVRDVGAVDNHGNTIVSVVGFNESEQKVV